MAQDPGRLIGEAGWATVPELLVHVSRRTLTDWVAAGRLVRLRPGVLALPGTGPDWRTRLAAALHGREAVASHVTALALWELAQHPPGPVHVTVGPQGSGRGPAGVLVHRAAGSWAERRRVDGLAVSSPERAVLEAWGASAPGARAAVRAAVVAPLVLDERVVGTVGAYGPSASPGLVSAVGEVARWVSGQLELAELDESRSRLAEAQVRALRAQISPHFVFNALTAIASFVRTDPVRARELLLDFADFTRYSSRTHGEFTTLAEELRSIDRYLLLEKARFGERLQVVLRVAPEVLPVAIPYLCLQPLVENAVQHGLEGGRGSGTVTVVAQDDGGQCRITVEDDGAGSDPERVRQALAGVADDGEGHQSMGLGNVDARLRAVYGDDHGLLVETAEGAGTKVTVRVPKFSPGVRAGVRGS